MAKAVAKTAGKTAGPRKIRQSHGGALLSGGVPGNNGGRPPDEFKARMREIASSDEALAYIAECVNGEHGPKVAISAQQYVSERGYGKEAQLIAGDKDRPLEVVIRSE